MIVGFNHNITYQGVGFHVQTEDSGVQKPQLVTLLYHGGTIISSQKTVYADIIKVDNLEQVVEELAKEQHKGMLKKLTRGEFDERIVALGIALGGRDSKTDQEPDLTTQTPVVVEMESKAPENDIEEIAQSAPEPVSIVEEPIIDKFKPAKKDQELSLDDLILAYLTAGQRQ